MMISARNLHCGYNGADVLKGVSLELGTREIVSVIGPNGAGKTTLLRALSRILRPSSGQVLIDEHDIWNIAAGDFARTVAVVTQGEVPHDRTVEDYVMMGRIPHCRPFQLTESAEDLEIVRNSLIQTDSYALRGELMGRISAGQRQLARLALALAQSPNLLLCDEPTSYLDITHQAIILNLVRRLNREMGLGVIMVMHDLNLAAEFSDRLVLMENGRVRACARPDEVLEPGLIGEVYHTRTTTGRNPESGKPHVFISADGTTKRP